MKKLLILSGLVLIIFGAGIWYLLPAQTTVTLEKITPLPTPIPTAMPTQMPLPSAKVIPNDYQIFETFNNCGPASLSMALSYYGIHKTQAELGQELRPYQNPQGNNDDKDVTLSELANETEKLGLLAYYRPNGNITLLKKFIANGMPVIAETLLTKDDDIGHFRVVKGFDDTTQTILQDDSYQGHNISYSYSDFDFMWKRYNYQYLVLVPKNKQKIAEQILGKDLNEKTAWNETAAMDRAALQQNPSDVASRFNLSIALYYLGQYQQSVNEYEKVADQLPFRTLWYQIEPIEAYYHLGDYQKVFSMTDTILNGGNRAFSELYIIRGDIYKKQGNSPAAKAEYEKAVYYNVNMQAAKEALKSV